MEVDTPAMQAPQVESLSAGSAAAAGIPTLDASTQRLTSAAVKLESTDQQDAATVATSLPSVKISTGAAAPADAATSAAGPSSSPKAEQGVKLEPPSEDLSPEGTPEPSERTAVPESGKRGRRTVRSRARDASSDQSNREQSVDDDGTPDASPAPTDRASSLSKRRGRGQRAPTGRRSTERETTASPPPASGRASRRPTKRQTAAAAAKKAKEDAEQEKKDLQVDPWLHSCNACRGFTAESW